MFLAWHSIDQNVSPRVTPFILRVVADISDLSKEDDIVYLTAFLFASVSNIVPPSRKSVDLSHVLRLRDICVTLYGLSVTFRRTKTKGRCS